MLTNAHDVSTIRYGASTIQVGSATVASRPPTNISSLGVSDDESTLRQADRDPPAKEGQTDLTSEEQTDRQPACAATMFICAAFLSSSSCKLLSHLKSLDIIHD